MLLIGIIAKASETLSKANLKTQLGLSLFRGKQLMFHLESLLTLKLRDCLKNLFVSVIAWFRVELTINLTSGN